MDSPIPRAAVITVGTELTEGLRVDTNSAEIARALAARGFIVAELASVGDDLDALAESVRRLTSSHDLVVSTGGLGPTHDDITREAAARALDVTLTRDERLVAMLEPVLARHTQPGAAERILAQADVLPGAEVIDATTGTAPGLVVPTPRGLLVLLPGPPSEMRPMLEAFVRRFEGDRAAPVELGITGMTESDAQLIAQQVLAGVTGVRLTVLARPGDVRVILLDEGGGDAVMRRAAIAIRDELGERCFSDSGHSLAATVVSAATAKGVTLAFAESCTGGMITTELTAVPGASRCLLGGVVAYSDDVKAGLLGVDVAELAAHGAVSPQAAMAMAEGVRRATGSDIGVSVTGIAGPDGGSDAKPVGLVWFGVADGGTPTAHERRFPPTSRDAVRERATATALDLARMAIMRL